MGSLWMRSFTTISTWGFARARGWRELRRKARVGWEEGQEVQNSNTSLRIWGTKAAWPLAARERSWALSTDIVGGEGGAAECENGGRSCVGD